MKKSATCDDCTYSESTCNFFLAQIAYWVQLTYKWPRISKIHRKLFNYNYHEMKYNGILDNNEEIVMSAHLKVHQNITKK